jgi:hypothetical protein
MANVMTKKSIVRALIIIVAALILTLPTLFYGFPSYNHDGWVHALWYSSFASQLWSGDLYPRWLLDLNRGLGSPALFYYPPIPYYFTSLFKPLFQHDPDGLRQLGVSASLAVITSGWFAYLWLRRIAQPTAALVASVIYLAMPYHLAIDLYLRGAFAEVWSFVWMPLILYFARRLECGERFAVPGLAMSYALLIASHLPVAFIFSSVPILHILVTTETGRRKRVLAKAAAAMALGIGLAAIYLLPALAMRGYVSMQEMSRPEIHFEKWFVLTSFFSRGLSAYLSWQAISVVCVAGCAYIISSYHSDRIVRRERAFWAITAIIALVMMTPLSKPIWSALPILQNIQFPFRFNAILCMATAALLSFGCSSLKPATSHRTAWLAAALLIAFWILITPVVVWREYWVHPITRASYRGLIENNQDAAEYRPRWANRDAYYRLLTEMGQAGASTDKATVIEGSAEVTVEKWLPRTIGLRVSSANGARLCVKQLYYPGWRARVDGNGIELSVWASEPEGLLELIAPSGNHLLILQLMPEWPERWGKILSAAFLLIVIALIVQGLVLRSSSGTRAPYLVDRERREK